MRGERFNKILRGNVLTQRVVGIWVELLDGVVKAGTIITLERNLDVFIVRKGLEGHGLNMGK